MLLSTRFSRLLAVAVVATVTVAALITFAFTSDAVGGAGTRTVADSAQPSVSVQPEAAAEAGTSLMAEAAPTAAPTTASPTADPTSEVVEVATGPTAAPTTAAPTAAPTTPPAPAPTTPAAPAAECNLITALLGCR